MVSSPLHFHLCLQSVNNAAPHIGGSERFLGHTETCNGKNRRVTLFINNQVQAILKQKVAISKVINEEQVWGQLVAQLFISSAYCMANTVLRAKIHQWAKQSPCSHRPYFVGRYRQYADVGQMLGVGRGGGGGNKDWWGGEHDFGGDVWKDLTRWYVSRSRSKTRKQGVQISGERAEEAGRTKAQETSVLGQEMRNKANMAWVGNQGENSRKSDQRGLEMVFGVGECRSSRSLRQLRIMWQELY